MNDLEYADRKTLEQRLTRWLLHVNGFLVYTNTSKNYEQL